ncbi:hypothetical protein [Aliikangiella coralliicola]|uniref:Uncharacterized protein n=1 Tax=Aliikangiella coralliicola TaxID=2592383 RepID=A0A545UCD5_9GAMM|nr:hypothetical protein [Aliikangiella coralliicola]TQV87125.1 hypothetical protein FLL46_15075 [Aliikangiella coralliicola]
MQERFEKYQPDNQVGQQALLQLLKDLRNMMGISASFLMRYFKHLNTREEISLLYSLSCNFYRMEHRIEIQLQKQGVVTERKCYNAQVFRNLSYVNVDLVGTINQFLEERNRKALRK